MSNFYYREGPGAVENWEAILEKNNIGVRFTAEEFQLLVGDADEGHLISQTKRIYPNHLSVSPENIEDMIESGGEDKFSAILCDAWATDWGRLADADCNPRFPIRSIWLVEAGEGFLSIGGNKRVLRLNTSREAFLKVVPRQVIRSEMTSELKTIVNAPRGETSSEGVSGDVSPARRREDKEVA